MVMRIDRDYRIWEATAKDDSRPMLQEVLIERTEERMSAIGGRYNGVAVACDGFVLAIVPVWLDNEDVPGPVKADLLADAVKRWPIKAGAPEIQLGETEVSYMSKTGRVTAARSSGGTFPDYRKIVPEKRYCKEKRKGQTFAINPKLLQRLASALGVTYPKFTVAKRFDPIIIETHVGQGRELMVPFGLLMPAHTY
jgi:DNA polymerase III sliding clamp (beta) subunit (PCNA family)